MTDVPTARRYTDAVPTLKALFGDYPKTRPIWDGAVTTRLAKLEVADIPQATAGFKPLVRELAFDVAEVAIVTGLQAIDNGKPYSFLPFVMNGGFHHGSLMVNVASGVTSPKDLEGKRVGMRSWTQTTPTWVRGFLAEDFGVDLSKIRWMTFEDAHVAEFKDPPGVERAAAGGKLQQMLIDGEIDAALISGMEETDQVKRLVRDPAAAARAWSAEHQAVPINHMVAVRNELIAERPDIVRELFDVLLEARAVSGGSTFKDGIDMQPVGLAAVRNAVEIGTRYAYDQRLVSRKYEIDELFGPVTAALGGQ